MGWRKSSQVKVFCPAFLQKSGRGPGAEPLAARRSARNAPMLKEAQEGVKGGSLAGGPPFAGGSAARSLCALPLKPCRGRRPRRPARALTAGQIKTRKRTTRLRNSPFCCWLVLPCAAYSTPFLWSCPKKRGGAPKKGAWGGGAPVRFRDPPASPTRVGAATRPLRCPLRGRIGSLAPGARGLGWRKSSQVKVFCPAFLQKSGRGPGAEPLDARRSARNTPMPKEAQEGVKGGTLAGGSPFAGGLSRPQSLRRRGAGGELRKGSSGTPTPTGLVRRHGAGGHPGVRAGVEPRPYRGRRNAVRLAVTVTAGRRGRRPLQGWCGDTGPAVIPASGRGWNPAPTGAGGTR